MDVKTLRTAVAPVLWGSTYLLIAEVLPADRPLFTAACRVLPAGLVLVAPTWRRWRPHGAEWSRVAVLSVANFGLFFPLLVVAAALMPGGVVAAFGGITPLVVVALTALLDRRRPSRSAVLVGLAAAAGVALVAGRPDAHYPLGGVAAAVAANVSFAVGIVLTRRSAPPVSPVGHAGWQLLVAGGGLGVLAFAVEGPPPALAPQQVLGLGYFSLVCTAGAFLLWFDGVRSLPVVAPPLLSLAAPLTGATLGWAVLGQALSATQILGFAVTGLAVAYGAFHTSGRPPAPRFRSDGPRLVAATAPAGRGRA